MPPCPSKAEVKATTNARINKTVRMSRSLRLMKLKATVAAETMVDQGVGKKHGSHERYLARKKGCIIRGEDSDC